MFDWPDAPNAYLAEEIKKFVGIPVVTAGKIGNPEVAQRVLEKQQADLVGFGRALVADPYLPAKVKKGQWDAVIKCRYCRYCRQLVRAGKALNCHLWG